MTIRQVQILFLCLIILSIAGVPDTASASPPGENLLAPLGSGSDVIRVINSYRAQNGLPALTANPLLTTLAQGQSDYQASIQTVTHTGPGGTSPEDRAAAAGYGGGNFFYLSEIIYGGYEAGVNDALSWWQNSSLHNGIMLASRYTEIGAGVAYSGDRTYYTAVLGGPTNTGNSNSGSGTGAGSGSESSPNPTDLAYIVIPVQKATPQADGSIIHTVQQGQSIWTIEAIYELEPGTLRQLNEIPSYPYVFPGDQLLIKLPTEAISTPAPAKAEDTVNQNEKTALSTPLSFNDQAEMTPTEIITFTKPTRVSSEIRQPISNSNETPKNFSTARYAAIAALLILVVVLIGSMFIQKPKSQIDNDE